MCLTLSTSLKFRENGAGKKWLKSAKNWTRFIKYLKKRPKKALFLLGDEKYDINLEFYPDFALNRAILHICFSLCLYFVQFRQRNFGTQKPFSARKNWSILCFATFLAKSILYFMAQVIFFIKKSLRLLYMTHYVHPIFSSFFTLREPKFAKFWGYKLSFRTFQPCNSNFLIWFGLHGM